MAGKGKWFYSKTRYKTQKRDRHGRWSTGGISTKPAGKVGTGGVSRGGYQGKTTKRYAAYQARLASEKKAARRAKVKKVAIGVAAVGAVAAAAYVGVNMQSKGRVPTMKSGKASGPAAARPPRALGAPAPKKVRTGNKNTAPTVGHAIELGPAKPVQMKAMSGQKVGDLRPSVTQVRARLNGKANPTSNPQPTKYVYKGKESEWVDPHNPMKRTQTLKAGPKKGKAARDESPDIIGEVVMKKYKPGYNPSARELLVLGTTSGATVKGNKVVKAGVLQGKKAKADISPGKAAEALMYKMMKEQAKNVGQSKVLKNAAAKPQNKAQRNIQRLLDAYDANPKTISRADRLKLKKGGYI